MTAYSPLIAFFPTAWYDSPTLHSALLLGSVLLVLSALVIWPIMAFLRRRRDETATSGPRVAR